MIDEDEERPTDEMSALEAAEDYKRQRQAAADRETRFGAEVRARFEKYRQDDGGRPLAIARQYASSDQEAQALVDRLWAEVTPAGLSPLDAPFGHRIISGLAKQVEAVCADGEIPLREGVTIGVSPVAGLDASQNGVMGIGASIIDFSMPFVMFCNQMGVLLTRTLSYVEVEGGYRILFDPAKARERLTTEEPLVRAWGQVLFAFAYDGWPGELGRLPGDADLIATRTEIVKAMELFAVAHEIGHHVLVHGGMEATDEQPDRTREEHDADSFARIISMALGGQDPVSGFAISGGGGVLVLGALDLVRRAKHVLATGNTDFPPRETHPEVPDRIARIALFDTFAPPESREQMAGMRSDLFAILGEVWDAVLPIFLGLHHDVGVRLEREDPEKFAWMALI